MDKSTFSLKQTEYINIFNNYANERFLQLSDVQETLLSAMKYSFFAGGKRVRPVLMLACADLCGVDKEKVLPFAFALECIHTYSLIHDDLPAMDNDDYRRGKLTNHKVYGEAIAILAGDALLNLAFSVCAQECVRNCVPTVCEASFFLSYCAGCNGMIAGQVEDILSEKNFVKDEKILEFIEVNKTARLIMASVAVPCILSKKYFDEMCEVGYLLGKQFQIIDDILDVESNVSVLGKTVGKDEESGKLTFVSLFGINKAKEQAKELYSQTIDILKDVDNSGFLLEFCEKLLTRIN